MKPTQFILKSFMFSYLALGGMVIDGTAEEHHPLSQIKLPPGFRIAIYASGLDRPRSLAIDGTTVFVGSRHTAISRSPASSHVRIPTTGRERRALVDSRNIYSNS